jgi:hypothetical protein
VVSLGLTVTSASFRYDSLGQSGRQMATVLDVAKICNYSDAPPGNGVFCPESGNLNSNTTLNSWSYLDSVNSGGQKTVYKYGVIGDKELGANVTLATLPSGWVLAKGNLPWMAMWVTCDSMSISADFAGAGITSNASIYVNDTLIDILDIANMPGWNGVVYRDDSGQTHSADTLHL